ncbi:MAG: ornithine cyclodeaminase [Legionellaceae bacterium]|nr:ornithine cyclodeaminase [Legionellaceae bacterium]
MLLLDTADIHTMVKHVGLSKFYLQLLEQLEKDFKNWEQFKKSPRHAIHVEGGVMELMPICDDAYYSFKYVNGHPGNPLQGQLNIVGLGMLADIKNGYPLMLASMTILTAIRTAAVSALSSQYLAKQSSKKIAIIGCGAQSEFQILAHHAIFNLDEVRCFDLASDAMERFARNLASESFDVMMAGTYLEAISGADIIITSTSRKGKHEVLHLNDITPGQHICAIGGDSPGKTELDPNLLKQAKLVIEYFPQTQEEGEIQNLKPDAAEHIYAELWELVNKTKPGRLDDYEITVFDAVGFALEDFSVLKLCYALAEKQKLGTRFDLDGGVLEDPKDLYGLFLKDEHGA